MGFYVSVPRSPLFHYPYGHPLNFLKSSVHIFFPLEWNGPTSPSVSFLRLSLLGILRNEPWGRKDRFMHQHQTRNFLRKVDLYLEQVNTLHHHHCSSSENYSLRTKLQWVTLLQFLTHSVAYIYSKLSISTYFILPQNSTPLHLLCSCDISRFYFQNLWVD